MVLLHFHLCLIQKFGISTPTWVEKRCHQIGGKSAADAFFPGLPVAELMGGTSHWRCLAGLAAMFPSELGEKADPFAPAPAGIRPEWYFLAQFYTLKLIPGQCPVIRRGTRRGTRFRNRWRLWAGLPLWGAREDGTARSRLVWRRSGIYSLPQHFRVLGYLR